MTKKAKPEKCYARRIEDGARKQHGRDDTVHTMSEFSQQHTEYSFYDGFMPSRVDLLNDPIDKSLRLFAIPMAFSFLINIIYTQIDRWYVSRLGDAAIAAIGAADQVAFFLFTVASGFGVGTGIIIARRIGEGNRLEASRTAAQAVVGMAIIGSVVTIAMFSFLDRVPALLNLNPEVGMNVTYYLGGLFLGYTANVLNFQLFAIVRSMGNTFYPMIVLVATTVVNAVVAPFLIFGLGPFPEMGIYGAGLATAIAQILGCVVSLWALILGKAGMRIDFAGFRMDLSVLVRIAKQGLPASLQMLSVSVNRLFLFGIVGGYGTTVTAAYTLGTNVDLVVYMTVFAMGMSIEVITGQNLGAGKLERVYAYHRSAVKQMSVLMIALAVFVWFFGEPFVQMFTRNPETVSIAVSYLHTTVIGYLFFAIGFITIRVVSGAGAALLSMSVIAGSLLGIQFPLALLFSQGLGWGPQGVWYAIVTANICFCILSLVVLRSKVWLRARV